MRPGGDRDQADDKRAVAGGEIAGRGVEFVPSRRREIRAAGSLSSVPLPFLLRTPAYSLFRAGILAHLTRYALAANAGKCLVAPER